METLFELLSHQFTWGLLLGLFVACVSLWGHLKTKRELKRYQRHLSDKMELEARQLEGLRKDIEKLQKENENLRLKVGMLNEKPDQRQVRDLEVFARAEKRMIVNAPGFAAAWETAKAQVASDMEEEDHGRSLPKRLFSRLLGTSQEDPGAGTRPTEFVETPPESRSQEIPDGTTNNGSEAKDPERAS